MRNYTTKISEYILYFLIIVTPFLYGSVEPEAIACIELAVFFLFFFWLLTQTAQKNLLCYRTPLSVGISVFLVYCILQLIFSSVKTVSFLPHSLYFHASSTAFVLILAYYCLYVAIIQTVREKRIIYHILSCLISIGFTSSLFFLVRYFGFNAPRSILNPDHFSAYLGMIIPLALVLVFVPLNRDKQEHAHIKILFLFCTLIMSIALFLTMSRGGISSFILTLLVMLGLGSTRRTLRKHMGVFFLTIFLLTGALLWLGITPIIEKLLSVNAEIMPEYLAGRYPVWRGSLACIAQFPLFGSGIGTFSTVFPRFQEAFLLTKYAHAHNDYLELIVETGWTGFFIFLSTCLGFILYTLRTFYKRHNPFVISLSLGFFGSFASLFFHSFVDFNTHIPAIGVLTTILLGLFVTTLQYKEKPTRSIPLEKYRFILIPVILIGFFFCSVSVLKPVIANYYFNQAEKSIAADNFPAAENLLQKSIAADPENAEYYYLYGKIVSKRAALKQSSQDSHALLTQAQKAYEKALFYNPMNSAYYQSLAWTYGLLNKADKSYETFKKAIAHELANPYRYRTFALWLMHQPKTKKNEQILQQILKRMIYLHPLLAEEAFRQYYAYTKKLSSLKDITPDTVSGTFALWSFFSEKKQHKLAIQAQDKVLRLLDNALLAPSLELFLTAGDIYRAFGMYSRAVKVYKNAIAQNNENYWIYYNLGDTYAILGETDKAILSLRTALSLDTENSWGYYRLAQVYQKKGNTTQAEVLYKTILDLRAPDPSAERIALRELKKLEKQ